MVCCLLCCGVVVLLSVVVCCLLLLCDVMCVCVCVCLAFLTVDLYCSFASLTASRLAPWLCTCLGGAPTILSFSAFFRALKDLLTSFGTFFELGFFEIFRFIDLLVETAALISMSFVAASSNDMEVLDIGFNHLFLISDSCGETRCWKLATPSSEQTSTVFHHCFKSVLK